MDEIHRDQNVAIGSGRGMLSPPVAPNVLDGGRRRRSRLYERCASTIFLQKFIVFSIILNFLILYPGCGFTTFELQRLCVQMALANHLVVR